MADQQPPDEVSKILDSIINNKKPTYLEELQAKRSALETQNNLDQSAIQAEKTFEQEQRDASRSFRVSGAKASNSLTDRGTLNNLDSQISEDNHKKGTFH